MTAPPPPAARRPGFTLIEVLVAVAIIAILVGLLLVALAPVRRRVQVARAVSEINQLQIACDNFKGEGGFGFYPPGKFRIPGRAYPSTVDTIEAASYRLLRRMYPRWKIYTVNTLDPNKEIVGDTTKDGLTPLASLGTEFYFEESPFTDPSSTATYRKMADQSTSPDRLATARPVMDGAECLVYFLGGPELTGWAIGAPVAPTGSSKKGPFYEFNEGRLKVVFKDPNSPPSAPNVGDVDFRFRDPWGTPYAYFRARGSRYADRPYPSTPSDADTRAYYADSLVVVTDAARPAARSAARPLFTGYNGTPPPAGNPGREKWVNADGVQIISAGPDKLFPIRLLQPPDVPTAEVLDPAPLTSTELRAWRGQWVPGTTPFTQSYRPDGTPAVGGFDDLANFNNGVQLGADASSTR